MLFLYRPRQTWMPFALPRNRTEQAAYNRQLQEKFDVDSPSPAGGAGHDARSADRAEALGELHQTGVLTDAEFASAKAKLLAR